MNDRGCHTCGGTRWVPVDERLPDFSGTVWVCVPTADDNSPLLTTAWYEQEYQPGGFQLIALNPGARTVFEGGVTHWMRPVTPKEMLG